MYLGSLSTSPAVDHLWEHIYTDLYGAVYTGSTHDITETKQPCLQVR